MNNKRKSLRVTVLNGLLSASGGLDGNYVSLNTVERFDPGTGIWQFTTNMTEPRYSHYLLSDKQHL